jgi:hypothetical protein
VKFHLDVPTHFSVQDFNSQCSIPGSHPSLSSSPLATPQSVSTLSSLLSQLLTTISCPYSAAATCLPLTAETESDWHGLALLSCFGVRGHGGDKSVGDRGDGLASRHRGWIAGLFESRIDRVRRVKGMRNLGVNVEKGEMHSEPFWVIYHKSYRHPGILSLVVDIAS